MICDSRRGRSDGLWLRGSSKTGPIACLISCLSALFLMASSVVAQEESWLPARVFEGMVDQIKQRGAEKDLDPVTGDEFAQGFATKVRDSVGRLGESGVLESAPQFDKFDVPQMGQTHVDSMVRYQICNMVTMLQHTDPAFDDDPQAKVAAILGLTSFTMAALRLRQPYLDSGGSEGDIEALLTSSGMQPVLDGLRDDVEIREHVEERCNQTFEKLLIYFEPDDPESSRSGSRPDEGVRQ